MKDDAYSEIKIEKSSAPKYDSPEAETIMSIIRTLPWQKRAEVCGNIRYNPEFCSECGYNTPDGQPCQCTNDE